MTYPSKYKFICEYPQYKGILNVSSFEEYKSKLGSLKRKDDPNYKQVAGFSFEFIIGCWLELYGECRTIGIINYQPTYAGALDNPDHGADGYALAFAGKSGTRTRKSFVQLKYIENASATKIRNYGALPGLVGAALHEDATSEINVTIIAPINGQTRAMLENTTCFISNTFMDKFAPEFHHRIFIRVLRLDIIRPHFNNFLLWQKIRQKSGLFEQTEIDTV